MLLDIDMPEMNGLELLSCISNTPKTILTTAHSQFALESYEYGVIDYLLKPISLSRFIKSIERFLSLHQQETTEQPQDVELKVDGQIINLKQSEISYVQSYGNYVKVFTREKTYLAQTTTQELLSKLSTLLFIRIHKSFIVNLNSVTDYCDGDVFIEQVKLPIGITFKRELLERLSR